MSEDDLEVNADSDTSAATDDLFSAVTSALREMCRLDEVLDHRLSTHGRRKSHLSLLCEIDDVISQTSLSGPADMEVVGSEQSSPWTAVSSERRSHESNLTMTGDATEASLTEVAYDSEQNDLKKEVANFLSSTDEDFNREALSRDDLTVCEDLESTDTFSANEDTDHSYMRKLTDNATEVMESLANSVKDSIDGPDSCGESSKQTADTVGADLTLSAKRFLAREVQKAMQIRNQEQLSLADMKRKIANLRKAAQSDWGDVEQAISALRIPIDISRKDPSNLLEEPTRFADGKEFSQMDVEKAISESCTWKRWRIALADLHSSQSSELFNEPGFLEESSLDRVTRSDSDMINKRMRSLKSIVKSASQELNNLKRLDVKQEH
ncbi:hypothetical protein RvY_10493 [Ramazzottius varieornatus]|uniref:Uncharacterized protein n=1 Tax=Ramazzottius varieornatus TaxID=947166 RepID=A0A1D1VF08_RAMVA|nr:hypothetical protein RvY_10493 [Ramazzottius varieornatus]